MRQKAKKPGKQEGSNGFVGKFERPCWLASILYGWVARTYCRILMDIVGDQHVPPRLGGLLKAFEAQRVEGPKQPRGTWTLWSPSWSPAAAGPRVVFIDNLDSFSLNVANALTKLGAEVLMVPGRGPTSPSVEEVLNVRPSHLVLGPGPGRPEMSPLTMAFAKMALRGLPQLPPLLGLCLGHQALGVAEGWRLSPSPLGPCHGVTEEIWHHRGGLFSQLESPARTSAVFVRC
eukprot:s1867_g13.t1